MVKSRTNWNTDRSARPSEGTVATASPIRISRNTTEIARTLSRASCERARPSVKHDGQGKNNREHHRVNHDRVEGKCEYGSTEKHLRKHRPKQDRDKPSTGVGRVVVLPSVPLSLHRGSCEKFLVFFHGGVTMSFFPTGANDKFFFAFEKHHKLIKGFWPLRPVKVSCPRRETRLYLFALHMVRRLSTFSFGLMSAGSLCDGAAVGRAKRTAGVEVFNSERNEPCLDKVRCNQRAAIHVAERFWWQVRFGTLDAQQQVTHGSFQVWTKWVSPSTSVGGFTLALSWTSSVSVLQSLKCEAFSVTG